MTALTLPLPTETAVLPLGFNPYCHERHLPLLLVFTADEAFWNTLFAAGMRGTHKIVRKQETDSISNALRLFRPGAVLLDLDPPQAWDAANSLLRQSGDPPVLLLTSRADQADFKIAIDEGYLVDKRANPATVLALAGSAMAAPGSNGRVHNIMQQSVLRWLEPSPGSPHRARPQRHWGINE